MNAHEALQASPGGAIRTETDGGLVAITKAADGYQVGFIPKMDGEWNLAGTISAGTYDSVDEAVAVARGTYSALQEWHPADENIIGTEPAVIVAPTVEGHRFPRRGGESRFGYRSTVAGHPLHPQLVLAPGGLLPFSFVMDVMHFATGRQSYADAAYHSMWGGCIGGLAAGAAGAVDYYSIPEENRKARASANIHAGMNVGVLAMFGLNLLLRKRNGGRPDLLSMVLSGIGAAGLLASAWYGGQLVYEHGLRVKGPDPLGHAKDVRPPGDEAIEQCFVSAEDALVREMKS